jgi:hypothetical protein
MREPDLQLTLFGQGPIERGQTERNLAEYPVTLIADRAPRGEQIRRYEWESKDRNGRLVKRSWTLAAAAGQTLPLGGDRDLYVILMQLAMEQGNEAPIVAFSRNELCERLNWTHGGRSYRRAKEALQRLASVTITAENLFVDAFGDTIPLQVFSVISDMALHDERKGSNERRSYIRWSDTMWESIRTGVLAPMDVGFYISLRTPLCRRLFEYLNKKRYVRLDRDGVPRFRRAFSIRVMHLAQAHLFLSVDRPSEARRQLDGPHAELVERGFLSAVEYAETRKGEPMVVYHYAAAAALSPRPAPRPVAAIEAPTPKEAELKFVAQETQRQEDALDALITPEIRAKAEAIVNSRKVARPREGSRAWAEMVQIEARRLVSQEAASAA